MVMFILLLFIFGTLFVEGVEGCLKEGVEGCRGVLNPDDEEVLTQSFNSVQTAMITMFKTVTGGEDWANFYTAMLPLGFRYSGLYIFFIAFCNFAFMNVLTGMFMENAMNFAKPDREAMAHEMHKADLQQVRALTELFEELDEDKDGAMTQQEFLDCMTNHPAVKDLFSSQGLEIKDTELFFRMLQDHEGVPMDINDFVDGCMKMKGGAKSMDIQALRFRLRDMRKVQADMSGKLDRLLQKCGTLLQQVPSNKPRHG
jgi:hypothetical protein